MVFLDLCPFFILFMIVYVFYVLFLDSKAIFFFIGVFILSFVYYFINTWIIYIFSPNFLVITEILSIFLKWMIEILFQNKNENEDSFNVVIKIIGLLIILITSIVYNEIVILHFFNCDKNIENQSPKEDELVEK